MRYTVCLGCQTWSRRSAVFRAGGPATWESYGQSFARFARILFRKAPLGMRTTKRRSALGFSHELRIEMSKPWFEEIPVHNVETKHRRIATRVPAPESWPLLEDMHRY